MDYMWDDFVQHNLTLDFIHVVIAVKQIGL